MNSVDPGVSVTMHLWVDECETDRTLVHPHTATYTVQPPMWCRGDPIAMEMHLDHLAKLQFLFDIRRSLQAGEATYLHLKDRSDYIVRGIMEQYTLPQRNDVAESVVRFNGPSMRVA